MSDSFLAIDFETANQSRDSACSVGLVRVEKNKIVRKTVHLIQPPYKNFVFTYIHGISWKDVALAPTFKELWADIAHEFDGINFLVAHNASFDASVLRACCARYGVAMPATPFKCTMKIARDQWNIYPTKLPDVCQYLDIELKHHEALSDAYACAHIMIAANKEAAARVKKAPGKAAAKSVSAASLITS